jgi:hypothetical protein
MTRATMATTIAIAWLGLAAPAAAQSASPAAIEIAVGPFYTNRSPLASGNAKETTPSGDAFSLFTTSTTLSAMTAGELQVGVYLTRHLEVFGAGTFGTRRLRIEVANDKESAAAVTASERLQQFTFTGGAIWLLSESRLAPFVTAQVGQLRELHEDKTLVETGLVYMAGGGVNMLLADRGSVGVRLTGRAVLRPKDFLLDTKRVTPAVSLAVFVRF